MKLSQVLAIVSFVGFVAAAPVASFNGAALEAREPTKVKVDRDVQLDAREPQKVKVDKRTKVKVDKCEAELDTREPQKVKVNKRTKVKVDKRSEEEEAILAPMRANGAH